MRSILVVAAMAAVLFIPSANAADQAFKGGLLSQPRSLYTCAVGSFSRVALSADPAPCCTGSFGCPQLLSNTGLLKPKRNNHI